MKNTKLIMIAKFVLLFLMLSAGCSKETPPPQVQEAVKSTVTIDKTVSYQTMDGFGFFGAYDVWWSSGQLWNDDWGDKVINDLGLTIWRNEWYPPSIPGASQDADWNKMKPVVSGLKSKADHYGVDLKFVVSVWSPPADMKWLCNFSWAGDQSATRNPGVVSTKNGGTLNPDKYGEYAGWLDSCLSSYKALGIDLYGMSLQNEPLFVEPYNSCTYTTFWYGDLLDSVVPKIKSKWPSVKIFGAENMLEMEGKSNNYPWFYHQAIKDHLNTRNNIDILAVHGYSDGVAASSGSELAKMWTNHKEQFSDAMNKPVWMTETSGYLETWKKTGNTPGAFNLAMDIYSGLVYGNMMAWIWWQGSELGGISNYSLMNGTSCGKKYYVSKHFFRFIRPGAVRISCSSDDPEVFALAFIHQLKGTETIVLINSANATRSVVLKGSDLPSSFNIYVTTGGGSNCSEAGSYHTGGTTRFDIPAMSVVTLQAGGNPL